MTIDFLQYIKIIQDNVILLIALKIGMILTLTLIFFVSKGLLKKLFSLLLLVIFISLNIFLNNFLYLVLSFIVILLLYIVISMYLFFKENETKFILMNKLRGNKNKLSLLTTHTLSGFNLQDKIHNTKVSFKNKDTIVSDDILSLYKDVEKEQYRYQLLDKTKGSLYKLRVFIIKFRPLWDLIIFETKIIILSLIIVNFYYITEIVKFFLNFSLYYKF